MIKTPLVRTGSEDTTGWKTRGSGFGADHGELPQAENELTTRVLGLLGLQRDTLAVLDL